MNSYQVLARNYSEAHENKIHSDEIARKYGFKGALVPGVAVYGHMTHPLVERFGKSWLARSVSSVRFLKPAYDGDALDISLTENAAGLHVHCHNALGELLAEMHTAMPDTMPAAEDQGCFDGQPKPEGRVDMTWDTVIVDQPFARWHWQVTEDGNHTYASQVADELTEYRHCAHPHWLLAVANRALTREYLMPAWIHVGSEIRFRDLLRIGDTVEVRAVPLEKWERKGHQFIKLYVAYYHDHTLATEIFHTAIFRVAE